MNQTKQQGMVLLVSLMLLLMLTLLALGASSQSTLQLRIASNSELNNSAFQAAEAGIANWTEQYFSATDVSLFPEEWSAEPVAGNQTSSLTVVYSGPCPGQGFGRVSLNCFDLRSVGEVCESGTCSATAIHRQGGQRRQLNN